MRDLRDLGKTPTMAFVMLLLLGSKIVATLPWLLLKRFCKFFSANQKKGLIGLSFDHNLCCKYSNGSCKFILDIYVLKDFQ